MIDATGTLAYLDAGQGSLVMLLFATGSGVIGAWCGHAKGRAGIGFVLGFFLPFVGWLIAALLPAPKASSQESPPPSAAPSSAPDALQR